MHGDMTQSFETEVIRSIINHHHEWLNVSSIIPNNSKVVSILLRAFQYKNIEARLDWETQTATYEFEGTLQECLDKLKEISS